jgi:hypothetical protein
MAPFNPSPKDTTTARRLLLACFAFALPLCIVSGIKNRMVFPTVGLAPALTSALGSITILAMGLSETPKARNAPKNIVVALTATFDFAHAGLFIGILIASWIKLGDQGYGWGHQYVEDRAVFAYATVPLFIEL